MNEIETTPHEELKTSPGPGKEVAPLDEKSIALVKPKEGEPILSSIDLANEEIPDLYQTDQYVALPMDLNSQYWFPEVEGESRRMVFSHFVTALVPDKFGPTKGVNGETVLLETAVFLERKDETIKTVRQSSKNLVIGLQGLQVTPGTLCEIVFLKLTRFPNGNTGQTWSIFPVKKLPPKN
jgi:hypothetical protein